MYRMSGMWVCEWKKGLKSSSSSSSLNYDFGKRWWQCWKTVAVFVGHSSFFPHLRLYCGSKLTIGGCGATQTCIFSDSILGFAFIFFPFDLFTVSRWNSPSIGSGLYLTKSETLLCWIIWGFLPIMASTIALRLYKVMDLIPVVVIINQMYCIFIFMVRYTIFVPFQTRMVSPERPVCLAH